jgi:hypothetical protein
MRLKTDPITAREHGRLSTRVSLPYTTTVLFLRSQARYQLRSITVGSIGFDRNQIIVALKPQYK